MGVQNPARAANQPPQQSAHEERVLHIGKYRVYLDRVPELIMLVVLAWAVAHTCVEQLGLSFQMALPAGLFAACQVQKLVNWIGGTPAKRE